MDGTENADVSVQQAGQSGQIEQNVDASQQEQAQGQPQFVSRDEFNRVLQEQERRIQGLVDKNVSRLDKRVKEAVDDVTKLVDLGKSTGLQFTDEQIAQLKDRAVHQALMTGDPAPSNQPAQPQAAQPNAQQVDSVTATAQMMMKKANIFIEKDDPELTMVDNTTDEPDVFLNSVRKAIEAKKQRTSRQVGNPAAMPGEMGTGGGSSNLTQQYLREIKEARGKGNRFANDIKTKYRGKGVDVDNVRVDW